ncbi:protein MpMLS1b [Marchantia polymorpha subsp. ruderalis]|uniref:Isocitrate lyase n=2 Tax=Marchantia polymorpha TaxID=3197 RepID=A0AAF6BQL9_MARPO|nr:hypothetical protein MARPO_0016s0095 [Marchantia polymorpha]BBN14303.1 hypothetical protein Mp_6g10540 [Marchantia polymorpha subsp. ruderalis]|eukprot:PTQ45037.1 hypothetical protein MARPO_0016s0095 [Marchantia polymorpha]
MMSAKAYGGLCSALEFQGLVARGRVTSGGRRNMAAIRSLNLSSSLPKLENLPPGCATSSGLIVGRSEAVGLWGRIETFSHTRLQRNLGSLSRNDSLWSVHTNLKSVVERGGYHRVDFTRAASYIPRQTQSQAARLREILAKPGVQLAPACFDGLSARLVEQAGFEYAFMGGFAVSAARLGAPDMGLLSYGEVLDQGRLITQAVSIPIIGDGDNGYGGVLNVKRTVKGFIQAGFAGIIIEDQESPKSCGHFGGKKVVSRADALTRIKAAVDARTELDSDIVIIARSDARQAESLDEALWRVKEFGNLGADVLFIDALATEEEMERFCQIAPGKWKMANMLEGGGRTPILDKKQLDALGFKLAAYPLSLIGVAMQAMEEALRGLKDGQIPSNEKLPCFDDLKYMLGVEKCYKEERQYAADSQETEVVAELQETEVVDIETNSVKTGGDQEDFRGYGVETLQFISSRYLRVKITGRDGGVKLDMEIPAWFLEPLASNIPVFAGVNIRQLLEDSLSTLSAGLGGGRTLVDFTSRNGDRVQIILVQSSV